MDVEGRLVSKILHERVIVPVLDAKITPVFFHDQDYRDIYEWIRDYFSEYGEAPPFSAFTDEFDPDDFPLVPPEEIEEERLDYLIDEIRRTRKFNLLQSTFTRAADPLQDWKLDEAVNILSSGLADVHTEVSVLKDVNLIENWERRLDEYEALKELDGGLRGIPTGFPTLDEALSGLQEEQLVTFIAEPKAGKSTLMMRMAISSHEDGKVPLFVSFEMSAQEQWARHDSMRTGVSHHRLITGALRSSEERRLAKALEAMKDRQPFVLSTDIASATTVSGLAAKIEQHRPDIVFVDGVYLMDDEEGADKGTPLALTNLTRGLKRLAQRTSLPVVCSTQVLTWKMSRRRGLTADSIGYSSSFAQDSDVILGLENMEDEEDMKRMRIVIARNAPKVDVLIRWDWEEGDFEEVEEYAPEEDYEGLGSRPY